MIAHVSNLALDVAGRWHHDSKSPNQQPLNAAEIDHSHHTGVRITIRTTRSTQFMSQQRVHFASFLIDKCPVLKLRTHTHNHLVFANMWASKSWMRSGLSAWLNDVPHLRLPNPSYAEAEPDGLTAQLQTSSPGYLRPLLPGRCVLGPVASPGFAIEIYFGCVFFIFLQDQFSLLFRSMFSQ